MDAYGFVDCEPTASLWGGRPDGDATLVVTDARDSWPATLRTWTDDVDRLADTRFGDLEPRLLAALHDRIGGIDGAHDPVLGRVDHGLHNLLVDPDRGEVTALLDWAFTLAVPPAYDLACVEWVASGAALAALPGARDQRVLVGDALLDGYQLAGGTVPDDYDDRRALYERLSLVRSMNHLDAGVAEVPAGHVGAAADWHRAEAEALLDGD